MERTNKGITALGVHCFAGGITLGAEQYLDVIGHCEVSTFGVATVRLNRPQLPVWIDQDGRWDAVVGEYRGSVDVIYGNPPCAGFSAQNLTQRGPDNPKNVGIRQAVTLGARLGARVIAVESVRGARKVGAPFFDALYQSVRHQYPGQMWVLVNPYDHGVPQWRPRLFWVLAPERFALRLTPTHTPLLLDALAGIPPGAPNAESLDHTCEAWKQGMQACLPFLKVGGDLGRVQDVPDAVLQAVAPELFARRRRRAAVIQWPKRLRSDYPARVIDAHIKWAHPTEDRLLTAREHAALMGIPHDYEFAGTPASWPFQIGRGVCPPVAAWLAGEIVAYLRGQRQGRGSGVGVVDVSSAAPRHPGQMYLF